MAGLDPAIQRARAHERRDSFQHTDVRWLDGRLGGGHGDECESALMLLRQLDQRAALQADTLTPDGGGGYTETWQTFALAWVKVTPAGAADTFSSDALQSRARHRIALRRRADVAPGQRVAIGARCFKVHAVLDEGSREPLITLLCEELP